jgi:hypothetical protein
MKRLAVRRHEVTLDGVVGVFRAKKGSGYEEKCSAGSRFGLTFERFIAGRRVGSAHVEFRLLALGDKVSSLEVEVRPSGEIPEAFALWVQRDFRERVLVPGIESARRSCKANGSVGLSPSARRGERLQ